MTNRPVTIDHDVGLVDVAQKLKAHNVNSILVMDNKELVGIITDEDIVWKVVAQSRNFEDVMAFDIMERNLVDISPQKDIYAALTIMRDNNIRQLPVRDGDQLVGFITLKDILKIQPELFDIVAEKFELRHESERPAFSIEYEEGDCSICGNYDKKLVKISDQFVCRKCR